MNTRITFTVTDEMEEAIEKLKVYIAPEDVYLYLLFFLDHFSEFTDRLHEIDSESYTQICLEDEELLLFLNVVAGYKKMLST